MHIETTDFDYGVRISLLDDKIEAGHAYLYVLKNDLHIKPFGFMEDVYLEPEYRGQGLGDNLVKEIVKQAKEKNCYKLIGTTRHSKPGVQRLYEKLGFENHGIEFRMNF